MVAIKTFKLNSGHEMPAIGLGTWAARGGECYEATLNALKIGYRHIDTATMYENEEEVGRAIRDSGVPRNEIFLTTKVPCTWLRQPKESLEKSIKVMGLEYVDLLLMHWPVPCIENDSHPYEPTKPNGARNVDHDFNYKQVWELMQNLVDTGMTKAVGVSNFDTAQLEDLLTAPTTTVTPAVNQVELHPYLPQNKLLDYCSAKGIHVTAYCPLGASKVPVRDDPVITSLAEKHGASAAQILLSWHVQRGTSAVPKSANPERQAQNLESFELSPEEIKTIDGLFNTHKKRGVRPNMDGVPMFQDDDWYDPATDKDQSSR